jgi:ketosteroid isomerase-like protein
VRVTLNLLATGELSLITGDGPMKCVIMVSLAALMAAPANAGPSAETEKVASSIANFVDEVNKGDSAEALTHLARDVSITEDLAPFRWRGPRAGSDWLAAMQKNGERMGISDVQMKLGAPTQVLAQGDRAYEAIPGVVTLKGKGQTLHETGVLTFALQKVRGNWQIVVLAWGGAAAAP